MGKDDGQDHGQADGTQAGAGSVIVVPEDFVCARCGYPSGASGSVICPECGHVATAGEVGARDVRREVVVLVASVLGFLAGAAVAFGVADWLELRGFMEL